MPTAVITGANRGLGLEFARQYAADGWRVHACCRNPDKAVDLAALAESSGGTVTVHRLEVTDGAAVAALAESLGGAPVDLLLNNAGV
ncbi:MAG: SDR family NAD(P)-dependent oxidoreductase, partial [Minwuiales bacterium]|nr:SDR family NAD(P)-dependent oxidoreductase [Minwuiales bacterium]